LWVLIDGDMMKANENVKIAGGRPQGHWEERSKIFARHDEGKEKSL